MTENYCRVSNCEATLSANDICSDSIGGDIILHDANTTSTAQKRVGNTDLLTNQTYDYSASDNGQVVSFDHWNDARSDNIDLVLEENQLLKPARLELFKLVTDFLDSISVPYFISDGTALAVYRDGGTMIPHDYDTDVGIMEEHFLTVDRHLDLLPEYVLVREFCSFTKKTWIRDDGTEIPYDGTGMKRFAFKDKRNYSHLKLECSYKFTISVDVITWRPMPDDPDYLTVNFNCPMLDWTGIKFPKDVIFPTKGYEFEGMQVKGPNNLKNYLEINYGYLGRDAKWDEQTQRYVKRGSEVSISPGKL